MTNRIDIPYAYSAQIYPELITDKNGNIIRPRVAKTLEEQTARLRTRRKSLLRRGYAMHKIIL